MFDSSNNMDLLFSLNIIRFQDFKLLVHLNYWFDHYEIYTVD